jgi:hypothetical protein
MKANSQTTISMRTGINNKSERHHYHIDIFRGIKAGIVIALVIFWLPFFATAYFGGWLYALAYGISLLIICAVLGIISRHYEFVRSIHHSKSSAKITG